MATATTVASGSLPTPIHLPRVTIKFCTQCKWMLRAAYYAQELLSTFSTALGEVALQPSTGGAFIQHHHHHQQHQSITTQHRVLWDRKVDGGFPEAKELKRRVRDVIEPGRSLGHVDKDYPKDSATGSGALGEETKPSVRLGSSAATAANKVRVKEDCEDCR
ncbi:Rdx family-domain-containing protein [Microdochium trichocladiopsis]|uniref:Rdx family-domain-containing protein n=1 Tax=Microdochium trichocladiopsis TaxID=1682393 RepID=A0A9P8YF28_9PEZI|nr:Rdx family-domain-containing protein [Microdochium trichocladiopsis]KAH7038148.1 Rdx family-domain-containing protein [Microdochium trichocladiopsis]